MDSPSLPIEEIRGELLDALQAPSPRILLKAPTGSGKSTGVPPMMDDAGLASGLGAAARQFICDCFSLDKIEKLELQLLSEVGL